MRGFPASQVWCPEGILEFQWIAKTPTSGCKPAILASSRLSCFHMFSPYQNVSACPRPSFWFPMLCSGFTRCNHRSFIWWWNFDCGEKEEAPPYMPFLAFLAPFLSSWVSTPWRAAPLALQASLQWSSYQQMMFGNVGLLSGVYIGDEQQQSSTTTSCSCTATITGIHSAMTHDISSNPTQKLWPTEGLRTKVVCNFQPNTLKLKRHCFSR